MKNDRNLMRKFKIFNNLYFDGKLTVKLISWYDKEYKTFLGGSYNMGGQEDYILLNPVLKYRRLLQNKVLLHEMIHIWQFQVFRKSKNHDSYFVNKMIKISEASKIKLDTSYFYPED